jgi:hypothetical protein
MTVKLRHLAMVVLAVGLVGLGWGLASASTSTPKFARACINSKAALVLTASGSCKRGLRSVKVPLSTVVGPRGPQGIRGPAGGLTGFTRVLSSIHSIAAGAQAPTTATCPGSTKVIGGGEVSDGGNGTDVIASYPVSDTQWLVSVFNNTGNSEDIWAYAICANATG